MEKQLYWEPVTIEELELIVALLSSIAEVNDVSWYTLNQKPMQVLLNSGFASTDAAVRPFAENHGFKKATVQDLVKFVLGRKVYKK